MEMYELQRSAMQLQVYSVSDAAIWLTVINFFFFLFSNNSGHNVSYRYWISVNTYSGINNIYQCKQNKLYF